MKHDREISVGRAGRPRPSRVDFGRIDSHQIERVLSSGDMSSLTPAEREYYDLMELVRGLRARMMLPGGDRIVTKAGIIKILKSDAYGLSDWMARQVYADAINFFYSDDGIRPKAWAALYAERLEKLADLAVADGRLREAKGFITEAAKLRGCYDQETETAIPVELLDAAPTVIYSADPDALGAPKADRRELEAFIDSIADVPEVTRLRVKEDAGIVRRDFRKRLEDTIKDFADESDS